MGSTMHEYLMAAGPDEFLDLGCIGDAGVFCRLGDGKYELQNVQRSATRFLFELLARLQEIGTVPMLDVRAYAAHIS